MTLWLVFAAICVWLVRDALKVHAQAPECGVGSDRRGDKRRVQMSLHPSTRCGSGGPDSDPPR